MLVPIGFICFVVALFLFVLLRVLRGPGGKGVGYLCWCVMGICIVAGSPVPPPPAAKVFANLWAVSLILVPVWWFYRWASKQRQQQ
jgi:hypothetical protein